MRIHVLGGRDLVLGFRLAGLPGDVVGPGEDVAGALERAAADPEVAILLVSSPLARAAPEAVARLRVREGYPILFEVPEHGGPPRDPEALMKFVGEAVGLRL
jgi:V/A-type H+-transporting ATPase subunit F